jgi:predicted 3-demethylubiquinone-9 3-methyltransferase (glyoxalase superfamily)
MSVSKLTTCLWFDGQAEEAASFYTSIFKNSKVTGRHYFPEAGKEFHGREAGSLMTIEFELNDQKFVGLNGGPHFKFTGAISIMVNCKDQAEVDYYWDKLGEGGDKSKRQCGWLADKFGLSWQIVPDDFHEMLNSTEIEKRDRAYVAMLHMEKLDIAGLRKAFHGE